MKRRIAYETLVLAFICMADLVTTLWWLLSNQADEANPLFRKMLDCPCGIWIFATAKIIVCLVALGSLEYARKHTSKFTKFMTWFGIVAYVGAYVVAWIWNNQM